MRLVHKLAYSVNDNPKLIQDCEERAMKHSCDSNTSWVGGFDKGYGNHQPCVLVA